MERPDINLEYEQRMYDEIQRVRTQNPHNVGIKIEVGPEVPEGITQFCGVPVIRHERKKNWLPWAYAFSEQS